MQKRIRHIDLWFREYGVHISLAVIVIAFGAILLLLAGSQSRLAEQSEQSKKILLQLKGVTDQISASSQQRTEQINDLNAHMDCIVAFFSQEDRTQKSIDDIETCSLKNSSTGRTEVPKASANTNSETPTSQQSQPVPTTPAAPQNPPADNPPAQRGLLDTLLSPITNLFSGL